MAHGVGRHHMRISRISAETDKALESRRDGKTSYNRQQTRYLAIISRRPALLNEKWGKSRRDRPHPYHPYRSSPQRNRTRMIGWFCLCRSKWCGRMCGVPMTPVAIGPSAGGSAASTRVCESRSSAQGSDPNCAFSCFRWG